MIREFYLINANGDTYDLNKQDIFFINPSGLGLSLTNQYVSYYNNFIELYKNTNQNNIEFDLIINADTNDQDYQLYNNFVSFLLVGGLQLQYITSAGDYKRYINLREITKTELKNFNVFRERIIFESLTPWRNVINIWNDSTNQNQEDAEIINGKIFAHFDTNNTSNQNSIAYIDFNDDVSNPPTPTGYIYDITLQAQRNINYNNTSSSTSESTGIIFTLMINNDTDLTQTQIIIQNTDNNNNTLMDAYFTPSDWNSDVFGLQVSSDPFNYYAYWLDIHGNILRSALSDMDITKDNFIVSTKGQNTFFVNNKFNIKLDLILEWDVV